MTPGEKQIDDALVAERSAGLKAGTQWLILGALVLVAFHMVGFFDTKRMSEGIPAIVSLGGEMLPPDFSNVLDWFWPLIDTLIMSIAGTALAIILSIPLGLLAAANTTPNKIVYFLSRVLLNILRAVPELIMGIIFVAAVGFGPLPGVLALGLHSAGMVGKFFAETVEHVNEYPIESARATGASSLKTIRYAVLPQAFAQMADVCIYRWEYNFRASTVMGMVGAGGIGFELMASLRILQYQEVFAILLIILAMVTIIDSIGAWTRKQLR
jgi:phosphonate transport system permease protein